MAGNAVKIHNKKVAPPTDGITTGMFFDGEDNSFKGFSLGNQFMFDSQQLKSTGRIDSVSKTAAHTLELSDAGKLVEMNLSTDGNLTIPAEEDVDFPIGTTILASAYGAGRVTIVPDTGVTIRHAATSLVISGQYTIASVTKRGPDEWYASGALGGKGIATLTSSSTPGVNVDAYDALFITALATNATFAAPTGTPTEGQKLLISVTASGGNRNLSYNSAYAGGTDVTLPASVASGTTLYLGFMWRSAAAKWHLIAKAGGY